VTRRYLAIAAGGALGAALRWAVAAAWNHGGSFPWATFAVNVVGCGALGVVLAEEWDHPGSRLLLHDFAGIGFCGGLTTFSTFAVEMVDLVDAHRASLAFGYLASSVAAGFGVYVAAGVSTRRLRARRTPEATSRALALPSEEAP
jgi:fluoride exporter